MTVLTISLPNHIGSKELCFEENPTLWKVFCSLTNRDPDVPNYLWREQDVSEFIIDKVKKAKQNDAE